MKSIPRIRIVKSLQQDIKRYGIPRAKAHPHFAMEDYKTALDLALEGDQLAIAEGHCYRFCKPLPEAIRMPDVISMRDFPAQFIIPYRRDKLARNAVVRWRCEQHADELHQVLMYLSEPDLSRYLETQAKLDLTFTGPYFDDYPMEHHWATYAGDFVIAAEWLWFIGRFNEARQHIATALRGLEIRRERKESGPGRSDRIRYGCNLFSTWMDMKESRIPSSEINIFQLLELIERYLAAFSSENYSFSSCESYRVMLRIYSNWFKLEYGIDWPKREEFLNCFPHYCRPYAPAFAQLSDEKKREVEQWYAEVLRLADEWDVAGYYAFMNK